MSKKWKRAIKTLGPLGETYYTASNASAETITYYTLPVDGGWGDWTIAPDQPEGPDGEACGAGRLHLHKTFRGEYRQAGQYWWLARYLPSDVLGEDASKVRVRRLQLRRIDRAWFYRLIRWGFFQQADLRGAYLRGANLEGAYLRGADLPIGFKILNDR